MAVVLNKQRDLSFGKVATLFRQQYGQTVTRSGLVHAVHRAARQAQPTYDALCETVGGSPVVTPDEIGWKVAGTLQSLWTVATPDTTVYAIQSGRGFPEAAAPLGETFAGVIIRDGWAPSRRFTRAVHQTCLAHLIRRCRLPQAEHQRVRFVHAARTMLQQALALRDRYGLAVARGHLVIAPVSVSTSPARCRMCSGSRRISPLNFWPLHLLARSDRHRCDELAC